MSLQIPTLPEPFLPSDIKNDNQRINLLTNQVNNNINMIQNYFSNIRYIIQDKLDNYQTSSTNLLDLYSVYQEYNMDYNEKIRDTTNTIETNNRKSYYQNKSLDDLKTWYNYYYTAYMLLFVTIVIVIIMKLFKFFSQSYNLDKSKTINSVFMVFMFLLLLGLYPKYIHYIVKYIMAWTRVIGQQLPRDVNKDI
jgi:hypothetical protein